MFTFICIITLFQLVLSCKNSQLVSSSKNSQLVSSSKNSQLVESVKELDLLKYENRWYQVYGNRFDQTFQKYGNCITADYTIISENNVSVLNSEYSLTNKLEQISGYAYYKNNNSPGELFVHLDNVEYDAPYWIINLGPVVNNYYDWVIVSDPLKISLFVLTRDLDRYYLNYDNEIREILDDYGYKNLVPTLHKDCNYV